MPELSSSRRVVVAMSGGVDSSVAAALLVDQGYEVIGMTLQLQPCQEGVMARSCCGIDGIRQARQTAGILGIRHYVFPCMQEFETEVLLPAWKEYARGRTPNPCFLCNRMIKFDLLLDRARQLGADQVATGHYARIQAGPSGKYRLYRGTDKNKDQSYFLSSVPPEQWAHVLMPLSYLEKPEVRNLAEKYGLPNAGRQESQDACLVQKGQCFAEMLRRRFGAASVSGRVLDTRGRVLSTHPGIHHFTIGQRKGLGVAMTSRAWVKEIRPETGDVILTQDPEDLLSGGLKVFQVNWLIENVPREFPCEVQVRYRHPAQKARIEVIDSGCLQIRLDQPVRAVTPGQAAVFYDRDLVLGSGWIEEASP